ncbi:MAG: type III pantothenate kinase [Chloroflexi bacterium]|nr:type III pantothenate kinase [Chloroflexota bacterium]
MVTCIDVGNSALKVADAVDGVVGVVSRIATTAYPDPSAVRTLLDRSSGTVARVSVVPRWTGAIQDLCAARGREVYQAKAGSIPIPVRIPDPERIGADRLLGAWTARELFGAPVIVVDVGTATTIDVVDGGGGFVGGAILPGPELAIRSLGSDTALLPTVVAQLPERVIGRDTLEAIQSGVVLGHLAAIEGLLALIIDELDGKGRPTVVLTGGGSTALGSIDGVDTVDADLLLRGLGMLASRAMVMR